MAEKRAIIVTALVHIERIVKRRYTYSRQFIRFFVELAIFKSA